MNKARTLPIQKPRYLGRYTKNAFIALMITFSLSLASIAGTVLWLVREFN